MPPRLAPKYLKQQRRQNRNRLRTIRYAFPIFPVIVKAEMWDEIKADLLKQALVEHWAFSTEFPIGYLVIWSTAIFVLRYEDLFFPKGNNTTGVFPNFNAINSNTCN